MRNVVEVKGMTSGMQPADVKANIEPAFKGGGTVGARHVSLSAQTAR